jgi:Transposase IS66 family
VLDELDLQPLLGTSDEAVRAIVPALFNCLEKQAAEIVRLTEDVRRLADEILRLKGEHPAPRRGTPAPRSRDHSSEKERRTPKERKASKRGPIRIDATETLRVKRSTLPPDARRKGYVKTVVQEVVVVRRNICFLREKFYSPSTGKTYVAELPGGYEGGFGPGFKTLALGLCYGANVSFAQIQQLAANVHIRTSRGRLTTLLTRGHEVFEQEKQELLGAGLASSSAHGIDTTPTSVRGQTWAAHALCNDFYTAYHTTPTRERLAALDALQGGAPRRYRLDATAVAWVKAAGLPAKHLAALEKLPWSISLEAAAFEHLLNHHLPRLPVSCRKNILEAGAVAAYQAQEEVPVVDTLVCDDAPQWRGLARLALCWIHDGRHYKKLCPYLRHHRELVSEFRQSYWEYYRKLVAYREAPRRQDADALNQGFDTLFSTVTGFDLLDDRIAKTREKKAQLLQVLDDPTIPLHNNAAELAARRRVRKRDVSLAAGSVRGVRSWDIFQSLAETTRKLGVSFLEYLHDRLTCAGHVPRLAHLIAEQAISREGLAAAA